MVPGQSAITTAERLVQEMFLRVSGSLLSSTATRGRNFEAQVFREGCRWPGGEQNEDDAAPSPKRWVGGAV